MKRLPDHGNHPQVNQTKNCWWNYVDFHRCVKVQTENCQDVKPCLYFKKVYQVDSRINAIV
jgi:hypothetical protein